MNKKFIFFLLLPIIVLTSCKRPAASSVSEASENEVRNFIVQETDFTYFSSKAKLNYKDEVNNLKANVNIRIKKDSVIWISVNAAAGIEAFRCLITQDSIHILDRLKNEYSALDFKGLSEKLNTTLNYKMIQAMVLGNLMIPKTNEDKLRKSDTVYYHLMQKNGDLDIDNHVKIATMKVEMVEIRQPEDSNQLIIKYFNFVPLGNYSFPSKNEILLSHKEGTAYQNTNIDIEHSKPECPDKELNFPFNVPDRFKRR